MLIRFRLATSAILLSITLQTFIQAQDSRELRIISYNIHHAEGVDGKLDLERIASVIQSVKPDIVALQEVDRNVPRSGSVDQPAELARMLNMEYRFGKNLDLEQGEYGNAVLTNLSIEDFRNEGLPTTNNGEPRGAMVVRLKMEKASNSLTLLATHFDYRADSSDRINSVKKINTLIDGLDGPVVLAGDLNATTESRAIRLLLEGWTNTASQILPTIPVDVPTRQIDFIFLRPSKSNTYTWKVKETKVLDERIASDHRPILSVVELSGASR